MALAKPDVYPSGLVKTYDKPLNAGLGAKIFTLLPRYWISRFNDRLTRFMNRKRWRFLASLISLCILSIILALSYAVSAPSRADDKDSITPPVNVQVAPMILPSPIFRQWMHSREEDRGDILVYRPNDYSFPPARGREGLEFCENGEFLYYSMGPTDRSLAVSGRWSIQQTNVVEIQFTDRSIPSYTLTIIECNEQILKVRRKATEPNH